MLQRKGIIALMGSGELTGTMVEVHKELLVGLGPSPTAVFLDTPAGFELNADEISRRVVEFFDRQVRNALSVVSYKGRRRVSAFEASRAFLQLRQADFILIGPGSPTYAVRQWQQTPVPEIFVEQVEKGGCLAAASAAALTLGRYVLPVYEIYKAGQDIHWEEGLNILEPFGLPLVIIPHWNNAEGGTHDTRYCYMGEPRLRQLESLLPAGTAILGLDEHTACLLDLEKEEAAVRGIGSVTLRREGRERVFRKGERFSLEVLRSGGPAAESFKEPVVSEGSAAAGSPRETFRERVRSLEISFHRALEEHEIREMINAVLEMDRVIWKGQQDLESRESIAQAREIFRELLVAAGIGFGSLPVSRQACLTPLVDELMALRERFRKEKKFEEADALRQSLERAGIRVEDTREGPQWRLE
jgi:cyanophycinase-like exopeptidase